MTVGELIDKLLAFDPELPVALADWHEMKGNPNSEEAAYVAENFGPYFARGRTVEGRYIKIGSD